MISIWRFRRNNLCPRCVKAIDEELVRLEQERVETEGAYFTKLATQAYQIHKLKGSLEKMIRIAKALQSKSLYPTPTSEQFIEDAERLLEQKWTK